MNAYTPPSFPLALPVPLSPSQPDAPEGDAGPTHKKNLKIIALAVLIEVGISGGIFYGAWENAQIFAASNPVFMLLAPALCVVLEFIKVPVGVCSQTHPSAAKRALAAFVLLLAATSTAINAVPIFAKLWKPQLAVVRQDAENLAVAVANKATFDKKMQAAKDAKAEAETVYKEAQASRRTARAGIGKARRERDADAQRTDLSDARKDVSDAKKKFDDASAALAKLNPKPIDDAVRDGESALRAGRQASTLHWIYGAATGAEVSSVSDKELAPVLVGAVGLPSVLVAAISSLLSILAVSAIARPKAPTAAAEKTFVGPDTLVADLDARINRAVDALEARQSKPETPASPDERPAPPSPAASEPATAAAPAQPKKAPAARRRGRPRKTPAVPNGGKKTGNGDARSWPPPPSSQQP